jgi:hypothetical protein
MLMDDLRGRLANRVQLTTDGHKAYLSAVEEAFGADIDFAMLVKLYGEPIGFPGSLAPLQPHGLRRNPQGQDHRQPRSPAHLDEVHGAGEPTMPMSMRRFTRLTNAFSKKLQNHEYMVALYALWYNFVRIHKTLRTSPAMAAGIESRLWSMEDVVALIDARSAKGSGETLIGG